MSSIVPDYSLVAFGELMLRLDPPQAGRLATAEAFEARYTGAEANVAASLAGFGVATEVVSVVPDNTIGQACVNSLRRFGVGTSLIQRRPGRLGVLFHEQGGAGRPPVVLYDRAGSAFAVTDSAAYDWPKILSGRSWLHVSGTAGALGPRVREALHAAVATAHEGGLGVSLDLNYRASLWSLEEAGAALRPVLEHVTVLLGVGAEAAAMFGLGLRSRDGLAGDSTLEDHIALAEQLVEMFGLDAAAGTRRSGDEDGTVLLQGLLANAKGSHVSRPYPVVDDIGRIGTGDAFAAGLLRGVLEGRPSQETVEFAAAAAHLKQSIHGDINTVTLAEVTAVMVGTTLDRIQR